MRSRADGASGRLKANRRYFTLSKGSKPGYRRDVERSFMVYVDEASTSGFEIERKEV